MGIGNTSMLCAVPDCDQPVHAYGLCGRHCGHLVRHGHPTIKKPKICTPCCVVGCGKFAYAGTRTAQPLCNSHQSMFRRYGRTTKTKPRKHDDSLKSRMCSACKTEKPIDQFASKAKAPTAGGTLFSSQCKVCLAAYKRRIRAAQGAVSREELKRRAEEKRQQRQMEIGRRKSMMDEAREARRSSPYAVCRHCGEQKPKVEFWSIGRCKSCERDMFKQGVDALDEKYVRRLMAKTSTVLRCSDIPASLVQAKQMQLKICRFLNEPRGEE